MRNYAKFSDLLGKTIVEITGGPLSDELHFHTKDGEHFRMYHEDDCCESVTIEDICGELEWLLNSPVLRAEERDSNEQQPGQKFGLTEESSFTWTFYEIATIKGAVTIRWYGSSNGYYSEKVDFVRVEK